MFLLRVCIIVRAVQCFRPSELNTFTNMKAVDFLADNVHHVASLLKFHMHSNTCYTINDKPCIQLLPSTGRPTEIIDTYTDSVPYDESMAPIPKTVAANLAKKSLPRYYTAFKLDNTDLASVGDGVTLETIVKDCTFKGEHFEAVVRIMNAMESAGISTMFRFCILSIRLENAGDVKMDVIYVEFKRLLSVIEWKFKNFNIATQPIREIVLAIDVILSVERSRQERYTFFEAKCLEFVHRYSNMVDYVSPIQFITTDVNQLSGKHALLEAMRSTISGASLIF